MSNISDNAYQILMERSGDIAVKVNEEVTYNVSNLLRDLYTKIYSLTAEINKLAERIPKQEIPKQEIPTKEISNLEGGGG